MPSAPGFQPASSSSFFGAFDILLDDALGRRIEVERVRIDEGEGRIGIAQQDGLGDLGAVDGDAHGFAHAGIGHHRPRDLEAVIEQLEIRLGRRHGQHRGRLGLGDELRRKLVGDVELAGHHRRDAAGILGHDLDDELFEFHRPLVLVHRGAPFVGVVALEHDLGARLPVIETPRPGAVGALDAVILAQRLDALLVVDHVGEHRELQQQFGERLLEFVFDGVRIGRAQFLDVAGAPGDTVP